MQNCVQIKLSTDHALYKAKIPLQACTLSQNKVNPEKLHLTAAKATPTGMLWFLVVKGKIAFNG